MPRTGGQSTATGVSFQGLAVARAIVDVHNGFAEFVRPEAPPHADLGGQALQHVVVDDYIIQKPTHRTYYQAKINAPGGGTWTLNKLLHEHILQDFHEQVVNDPEAECCLVTPCPCLLLDEVANRARAANSLAEFGKNLAGEQRDEFRRACRVLHIRQEEGHRLLRQCRIEIRTLDGMRADLLSLAQVSFADPVSAVDSFYSIAVQAMGCGQHLDAAAVQALLMQRSVFARPKLTEQELLQAVQAAGAQLRSVGQTIDGVHISQPVVDQMLAWAAQESGRETSVAALLDQAGSGKTVALAALLPRLEEAGCAVLAIKADRLTFATHEELAASLQLPASIPSIVQFLAAAGRRVAVLIDQVDALSSAMSRQPAAIQIILDLVAQLGRLERVSLIFACRLADWRYDYRIQTLQDHHPRQFDLLELTDEQIDMVLSTKGLRCKDLHPLTVKIVRRPLHLATLVKVINDRRRQDKSWSPTNRTIYTLQSLYQDLWDLKMSKADEPGGPAASVCEAVITDLAQRMQGSQQFVVPEAAVASQRRAVSWLISEGILDRQGKSLAMFHQTFFDFILARHFVGSGGSLVEHLAGTDQGLFYRPMIRQVLEYLRDADVQGYERTVQEVLVDKRIRKHLRWVAIAWLSQLADPGQQELNLLAPLLSEPDARRRVLSHMNGNTSWFDRIGIPRWTHWLATLPEQQVYDVIWFLRTIMPLRQSAVADLLEPHVGQNLMWNRTIAFCLSNLEGEWEDRPIALLLRLMRDPQAELDAEHSRWGHALKRLAGSRPAKACEVVGAVLRSFESKWLAWHQTKGQQPHLLSPTQEGLFPHAYEFPDVLMLLADKSPGEFLDATLDWTLRCMDITCYGHNDLWFRYDGHHIWQTKDVLAGRSTGALVAAIDLAYRNLAAQDTAAFRRYVAKALDAEVAPAQQMVARAYASQPIQYAPDAATFLAGDARRLQLGDAGYRTTGTVGLLKACSPHWPNQEFRQVEHAILTARLDRLEDLHDLHWRGHTHLQLLSVLDRRRLSSQGRNMLGQLERKFVGIVPQQPPASVDGRLPTAKAPVPQEAQAKMDDISWLSAMRHYTSVHSRLDTPADRRGGRLMLAEGLKEQAKRQPKRFLRLALEEMDDTYHPDYIAAILEGASKADAPIQSIQRVIHKFRCGLEKHCIRQVASAISEHADGPVPSDLVELLKHWSLHAEDPKTPRRIFTPRGKRPSLSLVDDGINTDRGSAMWHLAKVLLVAKPPRYREYIDIAAQVALDPSMAVRAVCVQFLSPTLPSDAVRAWRVFRALVGKSKEQLRQQGAYDFIYYSLPRHTERAFWAIKSMLADRVSNQAREAGAKLACLAALDNSAAGQWRDKALCGDAAMRKGAAIVYAANITNSQVGKECQSRLELLMNDDDQNVRAAVATFPREIDGPRLWEVRAFMRRWVLSRSAEEGAEDVARLLEQHPLVDPQLTLDLAERFTALLSSPITETRTRHGTLSYHLVPAILNVYHRTTDTGERNRAMDLFERLEELGCPETQQALEAIDRI